MEDYQREFVDFLIQTKALRFGEYTLKSGRKSPYFFNAGDFNRGRDLERLGYFYACAVRELNKQPTVVFGPAYKGVPLSLSTSMAFSNHFDTDVYYSFDRKEVKTHGEGGWLVGRVPGVDDQVVIVDDVVTDGATKRESIQRLREATGANITGLVIALDRREQNLQGENSIETLAESTGVQVRAIITIDHVLQHLEGSAVLDSDTRARIQSYLAQYGLNA